MNPHSRRILKEIDAVLRQVPATLIDRLAHLITAAERIFVAGEGRSGLMGRALASRLVHLGLRVHEASEITCPRIRGTDLMIALSGSGETRTTLEKMLSAREVDAKVVLITANADTRFGDAADILLLIPAPPPPGRIARGIASGQPQRSLFEQSLLIVLDSTVLRLMELLEVTAEQMSRRHTNLE
ncbi:MAG: SIS domain-containing protein [Candidatus Brocadiae bacterium]|nr:SIS domain-containing protein [Candidatus Brocadiia bacterium]